MAEQTRIAVLVIIGIGKKDQADYEREAIQPLQQQLTEQIGDGAVIELVHWTDILYDEKERVRTGYHAQDPDLGYDALRRFFSGLITDVIAYQPQGKESDIYLNIHKKVANALDRLSKSAGPNAPLVILAHSMGGVVASNYLRELQQDTHESELLPEEVHHIAGDTPIERGETLAQLYTMGTMLALYSVRHKEFDEPMRVPSPELSQHYPARNLPTCWVNFYNRSDVLGYPLAFLNDAYASIVDDRPVNSGSWKTSWNPFSHMDYWGDEQIVQAITDGIMNLYRVLN